MKDCPSVSALAKELGIDRSNLYQWQHQLEHTGESSARVTSPVRELCKEVRELKRVLAEKTLEGIFQRRLAKSRSSAPEQQGLWRYGIYDQSLLPHRYAAQRFCPRASFGIFCESQEAS
jgi:transposase-like protein